MTISAPSTGMSSPSTKVAGTGIAGGAALVIEALVQNKHGVTTDVQTIVGGLTAIVSIALKLYHDIKLHGFHYAAVAQAASQVESIVKTDLPAAEGAASAVTGIGQS